MSTKFHNTLPSVAHLMLLVAILQCLFVAFEAAGVMHGVDSTDVHHETLLADASPETNSLDQGLIADAESCDHCCHCHGHCSHFTTPANGNTLVGEPLSSRPLSYERRLPTAYIQSIHRPPIA